MAQGPTNEDLLARVAAREEEAFAELYDRFAPGLLGLLVRILPEREAAEAVLLEVFQRLWTDARRWSRERASVSAGLVLMARAKGMERLWAGKRPEAPAKEPMAVGFPSWLPRPEEIALVDGRRELFKKVINQLPRAQREMLELTVFEGYTEIELAAKLGEPLAKVRSSLLAGMGFIRHRLAAVMRTWAANI